MLCLLCLCVQVPEGLGAMFVVPLCSGPGGFRCYVCCASVFRSPRV